MLSPNSNRNNLDENIKQRFKALVCNTFCPYALGAKVCFAPEWSLDLTVRNNVLELLPDLDRFVEDGEKESLDMFVIEVRAEEWISNIDPFARLLHRILYTLNEADPTRKVNLTDGITAKEWDFVYRSIRFFVPTFAPFYSINHPRYSHQEKSAFIVFQPDHSFDRRGINSKNPNRHKITKSIRKVFADNGSGYDLYLVSGSPKAERYIKPYLVGESPIKWWEKGIDQNDLL